ncbi:MAG: hypothetical protein R3B13_17030 [Polyangiaceae bacterium]
MMSPLRHVGSLLVFTLGFVTIAAVTLLVRWLRKRALEERVERELRETIDALEDDL